MQFAFNTAKRSIYTDTYCLKTVDILFSLGKLTFVIFYNELRRRIFDVKVTQI